MKTTTEPLPIDKKDLPELLKAARGAADQESFWERLGAHFDQRRAKQPVVEPRQTRPAR